MLKSLINYLRVCFCKHDWHTDEEWVEVVDNNDRFLRKGTKVYMRCKKCGEHNSHWKYDLKNE